MRRGEEPAPEEAVEPVDRVGEWMGPIVGVVAASILDGLRTAASGPYGPLRHPMAPRDVGLFVLNVAPLFAWIYLSARKVVLTRSDRSQRSDLVRWFVSSPLLVFLMSPVGCCWVRLFDHGPVDRSLLTSIQVFRSYLADAALAVPIHVAMGSALYVLFDLARLRPNSSDHFTD